MILRGTALVVIWKNEDSIPDVERNEVGSGDKQGAAVEVDQDRKIEGAHLMPMPLDTILR